MTDFQRLIAICATLKDEAEMFAQTCTSAAEDRVALAVHAERVANLYRLLCEEAAKHDCL